ncbi:MAG TPA: phosphatase PAP2 family protein [Rhizobiaceae bacterium]
MAKSELNHWRSPHDRSALTLTAGVAVALLFTVIGRFWTALGLDLRGSLSFLSVAMLLIVAIAYGRYRQMRECQPVLEVTLLFLSLTFALLPISYIAVRFNLPIADPWLAQMDAMLGFSWKGYVDFVDRFPLIAHGLLLAYTSFGLQLFGLPIYFALAGNASRAFAMVFAYGAIVVVAAFVSIWFPSHGALHHYGYGQADFLNVNTHFATSFLEQFHLTRSSERMTMVFEDAEGLLTFPSVHAAVAVLCAWAAWGSRYLRYPFLVLNVAMAASAISHGGHYAIDVPAGILLAVLAIILVKALFKDLDTRFSLANERDYFVRLTRPAMRAAPITAKP